MTSGDAPTPRVSVVVPVRNGRHELPLLLAALRRQTLGPSAFEVLVADDGSTDGGCDGLQDDVLRLRVVTCAPRTSYSARNAAAQVAAAPVLAFTDSDCRPASDWLERGLAALERNEVVAGLVRYDVEGGLGLWGLLDVDTYLDQERAVRNGVAATANLFVGRELFARVGRFDGSIASNGDYDFVQRCVRSGARLGYAPDAEVVHPARDGAGPFLRKHWRTNRAAGLRHACHGEPLRISRDLVPLWRPARVRRYFGRSLRLDRHRLAVNGVCPRPLQDLAALPLMYVLLPYVGLAARIAGWRDGRRTRTQDLPPTFARPLS